MKTYPSKSTLQKEEATRKALFRWHCRMLYASQIGYVVTFALMNHALFVSQHPKDSFVGVGISAALTLVLLLSRFGLYAMHRWSIKGSDRRTQREIQRKVGKKRKRFNILYTGTKGSGKSSNLQHIKAKLSKEQTIHGTLMASEEGVTGHLYFLDAPPHLLHQSNLFTDHSQTPPIKSRRSVCYGLHILQGPSVYLHEEIAKLPPKVDGVVFVIQAKKDNFSTHQEEISSVRHLLARTQKNPNSIPWVIQHNKNNSDASFPTLETWGDLGLPQHTPLIEANTHTDQGVLETLHTILTQIAKRTP